MNYPWTRLAASGRVVNCCGMLIPSQSRVPEWIPIWHWECTRWREWCREHQRTRGGMMRHRSHLESHLCVLPPSGSGESPEILKFRGAIVPLAPFDYHPNEENSEADGRNGPCCSAGGRYVDEVKFRSVVHFTGVIYLRFRRGHPISHHDVDKNYSAKDFNTGSGDKGRRLGRSANGQSG